jgi:hypothetical protein
VESEDDGNYVQNDDIMMCFLTAAVCSRLFHKKEKEKRRRYFWNIFKLVLLLIISY